MSCFTTMTAATAGADLDSTKHVNYTAGMILGVDDFTQEFAYLSGRDRWLARDAVGYGTISGLSVGVEKDGKEGFRVIIAPGVAISPRGQLICVPTAQCAYLNQWLAAADLKELEKYVKQGNETSPPSSPPTDDDLSIYVVLCYRDCPTDDVPIPGEPCRDESELTAASRIKDDFSLELRFAPPKQAEEEAVKKFAAWLRQIEIVETGASTDLEDFVKAIRDKWLAPLTSPPTVTSPPTELQINQDDVAEYLRTAFRIWVTELRNVLSERKTGCSVEMSGGGKIEDCVLLGEIKISLTEVSPGWKVSDTEKPVVDDKMRPYLVHLRMLQEWLLGGNICCDETGTPITSPPITSPSITSPPLTSPSLTSPPITSPPITSPPIITPPIVSPPELPPQSYALDDLTDVALPSPLADGQVLIFRNGSWTAETPVTGDGGVTDHGALNGLADDDHPQYLLADGSRALTGNLNADNNQIINLAAANADGQAVIFQQAIKQDDAAGGDLDGTYPKPSVVKLQGREISNQEPNPNEVLTWNGDQWIPKKFEINEPDPNEPQQTFLILPLATVTRREITAGQITRVFYEIWMNIDAPENLAEIPKLDDGLFSIISELSNDTRSPATFLSKEIDYDVLPPKQFRNVFTIQLNLPPRTPEPNFLRFRFNMLAKDRVLYDGRKFSLAGYAEDRNITFSGYEKGEFATIFVRGAELKLS